jgi:hypothetical protein
MQVMTVRKERPSFKCTLACARTGTGGARCGQSTPGGMAQKIDFRLTTAVQIASLRPDEQYRVEFCG